MGMRFTHNNQEFEVTFERKHKKVRVRDKSSIYSGASVYTFEKSKYPFTTVTLREVVKGEKAEEWPILAEAEVNVLVGQDKYSPEAGRVWALRKLTTLVPDDMKAPIWEAYHSRPKGKSLREQNQELRDKIAMLENQLNVQKELYHKLLTEGSDA